MEGHGDELDVVSQVQEGIPPDAECSPYVIQNPLIGLLGHRLSEKAGIEATGPDAWKRYEELVKNCVDIPLVGLSIEQKDGLLREIIADNLSKPFQTSSLLLIAKMLSHFFELSNDPVYIGFGWPEWNEGWNKVIALVGINSSEWQQIGKKLLRQSSDLIAQFCPPQDEQPMVDVSVDDVPQQPRLLKRKRSDKDDGTEDEDESIVEEQGQIVPHSAGGIGSDLLSPMQRSPYMKSPSQGQTTTTVVVGAPRHPHGQLIGGPQGPSLVPVLTQGNAKPKLLDDPENFALWMRQKDEEDQKQQLLQLQMMEKLAQDKKLPQVGVLSSSPVGISPIEGLVGDGGDDGLDSPTPKKGAKKRRTSTPRKRTETGNFETMEVTHLLSLPQSEAAKSLNMSNATFSKRFRNVAGQEDRRWPYRQLQVVEKQLKDAMDISSADTLRNLQERKARLLAPAFILMEK